MHPGRQLGVLGLVFVVLYLCVFFAAGASGSWKQRLEPKLGLDLIGGTQATYIASQQGAPPTQEAMERAKDIIESRVNALGVSEAEVVIQGNNTIVVSLAGEAKEQLKSLGQAANMRFRLLTAVTGDVAASALNPQAPAPSASASGSANPSAPAAPGATPSAGAKSGVPAASSSPSTGGQGGGEAAPAPSGTPSVAPSAAAPAATPSASASAAAPAPVTADIKEQRAAIAKKVGAAWAEAEKLTAPVDLTTDPKAGLPFKAFADLSGAEVNALDPKMQFNVPTISCTQLNQRPDGAIDDVSAEVVACYQGAKVVLDKAEVVGDDISNASPQIDQQSRWVVSLDFDSEGQEKWAALTRKAFEAGTTEPCYIAASAFGPSSDGQTHCAVAVVLDKEVISAPQIQAVLTGQSQITGNFTAASAKELADQLKFGAIPVTFQPGPAETITASVGGQQLEAGLLAAAIGLGLVAVYSFFYYRLLGLVIFLSLGLSALLTFGALVFLGRSIGFTLTLAGIVGFIVSLGVAADSFIIYFERLKDEIHEGRSPRSAVPRAWHRARRTIISANAITIMCAVVLYIVSIGQVQGLAFALGLSTVLDLLVVFLFRHPIMTLLASTKAFMSPTVSGLGRVLRRSQTEEPVSSRVKEA
jgi:preprotein translocase subunit SecD